MLLQVFDPVARVDANRVGDVEAMGDIAAEGGDAIARHWCWDRYLELAQDIYSDSPNKNLKRHAVSFTKGLPGASSMRVELHREGDQSKLGRMVSDYLAELATPSEASAV